LKLNTRQLNRDHVKSTTFFLPSRIRIKWMLFPEIYLKVVPIVKSEGQTYIGGKGEAIEYAAKMRQLLDDTDWKQATH